MKYIFDFDDVLFNTKQFKQHIFSCLLKRGLSQRVTQAYYKKIREKEFSLKNFIMNLFLHEQIKKIDVQNTYEEIMHECPNFVNQELLIVVRNSGTANCYIVTCGEKEFQKNKIKRSGIAHLFSKITIEPGSKKRTVEKICAKNKGERVFFIDNTANHFEDLNLDKCPNLKTILYTGQDLRNFFIQN
ncbi:hypothetical protein A3G98_00865 [Candidatus Nomurabacteria bacterium RIFCSPLOWO2_12_FULL_37_8]|uniref:Haloacid dehalogenase-like hydrolase n=1 Tax=Candidatus Nomurabacteria bacterium RIFCSPLOWO2_12_FULL_37_8 TaxID=1801793 RepID=A0A1F6Y4Y1_9BACT|nr:MAG: hypothetical protein A3G98_00865 [Candidatus Nomurabacteria bacterium RIFCSPLOWO2_12_FULL_37_8]